MNLFYVVVQRACAVDVARATRYSTDAKRISRMEASSHKKKTPTTQVLRE